MATTHLLDNPWARLGWQLPVAAALTLLGLASFLRLLEPPGGTTPVPLPLEVQVVEPTRSIAEPPPAPRAIPRPVPPPPRAEPRPIERRPIAEPPPPAAAPPAAAPPTPPAPPTPSPLPPTELNKPVDVPPAVAGAPVAPPQPGLSAGPVTRATAEREGDPTAAPRAPTEGSRNAVPGTRDGTLGGGNVGARVIYQPLPEIPEALRHRSIEITAVARFQVAANGSAQVELTEPTPDPELNRAVLDTLRRWRFFPAMQDGKPVASTVDIRIPISIK